MSDEHRGGFVSVGDLALDLPDVPVPARRDRRRQARHFTQLDQGNLPQFASVENLLDDLHADD